MMKVVGIDVLSVTVIERLGVIASSQKTVSMPNDTVKWRILLNLAHHLLYNLVREI